MPVVLRIGPYAFYFYSHENNEPPHIHIRRELKRAKYWLEPVELHSAFGFRPYELRLLAKLVAENRKLFVEAWNDYFNS